MICQVGLVAAVGVINRQTAIGGILAIVAFALALGALWLLVSRRVAHATARWTDLISADRFGRVIVGAAVLNATLYNRHRRTHDDSPKRVPRRAAEPTDVPILR